MSAKAGTFLFLGIIGIVGIAALLTRRGERSPSPQRNYAREHTATGWEIVRPSRVASTPVYENKEEWEIVRGPDRLIEKVVIHRKVTENG